MGYPGGRVVKNPPANARDSRDVGSVSASGRSSGGGNGAWQATVHGVAKSQTQLSMRAHTRQY